ncbi:Uncharacterised protein [Chlamydia trachomatis]|nr:Uncharacterised protein [Chlamydia trachomatis]
MPSDKMAQIDDEMFQKVIDSAYRSHLRKESLMKKRIKRLAMSIVLTAGLLLAGSSVAYAESVFGGDWYYGTNYATGNASTNFYHGSTKHWTSIGTSSGKYERADANAGETASTWLWRTPGSSVTFKAGAYGRTVTR